MPQSNVPSSFREILDAALIASASYVSMNPGDYATETSLRLTLENSGRFTDAEAAYIASRFRVVRAVSPIIDFLATITGFNASLWRRYVDDAPTDQYTIGFEGTDSVVDLGVDILIGLEGEALGQVQALRDWVSRLYTDVEAGGFGFLDGSDEVDLTGHSLGGHLVQWAIGEFQGGVEDNIWIPDLPFTDGYTFNGAGIGSPLGAAWGIYRLPQNLRNLSNLFNAWEAYGAAETIYRVLSGNYLWNDGNFGIENIIGSAGPDLIPSFISGMRPGEDTRVFTEDQNSRSIAGEGNHFVGPTIASLFLYNVFEGFAGVDSEGRTQLIPKEMLRILQGSSNDPYESLERALNHIQRLLPGTAAAALAPANVDGPGGSDGTYEALAIAIAEELEDNPRPATVRDLTRLGPSFMSDEALRDDAIGLAYRVALMEAQPFILEGVDYQTAFNQDGDYDLDNFTERFIEDRADYADILWRANQQDLPFGEQLAGYRGPRYFENRLIDFERFSVGFGDQPPAETLRQIFFGDNSSDTYTGGDEDDSLYGLGGNDTIDGGLGDDYIEGGDGDDDLTGGEGRNELLGGDGFDTYRIGLEERAEITDSDNQGVIFVELEDGSFFQLGSQSINAVANQANVYRDQQGFTYSLSDTTLSIKGPDGQDIVIRDFDPAFIPMGINLAGFRAYQPPGDAVVFNVDAINPPPGDGLSTEYITQFGRFSNGTQTWDSAGVWFWFQDYEGYLEFGDEDLFRAEVINTIAVPDGVLTINQTRFYQIRGGFGDSLITGDDGFNWLADDVALWPVTPYLGHYGMGPVMGDDVLIGNGGDDWLSVSGGDDYVEGGAGDDIISSSHASFDISIAINGDPPFTFTPWGDLSWVSQEGNSSDDRLFGGDGNDYIIGHGGNQVMDGGADDDELFGGAGNDVLIGGTGNDVLSGDTRANGPLASRPPDAEPFEFDYFLDLDILTFDSTDPAQWGNDTLDGGEGDDILYGGAGDDTLLGGPGNDRLQGDFVFAYADVRPGLQNRPTDPTSIHGDDTLLGGEGNDELLGYGGDDLIEGGDGDDVAAGGEGSDILLGDAGIDELQGNEGDDFLYGGDGDDTLFGQEDNDELYGEDGMDQLVGGDGDDELSGGLMDDALFGEAGDDILLGGSGVDDLQGGDGNDTLFGGSGNDLLIGGAGDDTYVITGADGQDQITDTDGNNTLILDILPTDLSISLENGIYFIDYAPGNYLFMSPETFNSISTIEFGNGIGLDSSYFLGLTQPGGSSGSNLTLEPGASTDDLVIYGRNNDLILVYTGAEADWLDTSTFFGRDIIFEEGDALDFGYPSSAPAVSLTNFYVADAPYLTFVNDNSGGFVDLNTDPSIMRMFESGDEESLWLGSDAADTFSGGSRQDVFSGGDGDDQIDGGGGADSLAGGAGDDRYVYNIGDDEDVIVDESGFDTLQFGPGITPADLTITVDTGFLSVQVGPLDGFDRIRIAGWLDQADSPIDQFEFDDGTTLSVAEINALITGNLEPEVSAPLADVEFDYEQVFSFTIPAGSFTDPNGDPLTYTVGTSDGSALPSWLSFDPATQTFSGTTPSQSGADIFDVDVTVFDLSGLSTADTFSFTVGLNLILGTEGNDVLNGDALDNSIIGLAGDDDLFGGDGNDYLRGDEGRDDLFGDAGDDVLDGGLGFDTLTGGAGNDTLIAGTNDGSGSRLFGGDGDDIHITGDGRDILDGGDGANVYEIGLGGDRDTLEYLAQGTHTVRFGPGITLADISPSFEGAGQTFDLSIPYNLSDTTDFILMETVFLRGSSGSDEVVPATSSNPVNYVFEFEDGTSLTLVEMIDLAVIGTPGDDFLFPNSNNEAVFGGDGADRILGRDYIFFDNSNMLYGEGGDDDISGGEGDDFISGGDGEDVLLGGDDDDTIEGGADDDFIRGDDGNDNIDGGAGNDQIQAGEGDDIIMGGAGDDVIFGDGFFSGSDQIFGGDGNDTIDGGGRADFIEGGAGDDIISGGTSNVDARDMLRGGTGNDQFNDVSDIGATHYLYDLGDGQDTISDTGHVDVSGFLLEDRFEFVDGSGIQLEDLQVTRVDDNLVLTISATDSITFLDWFVSVDNQIEEFITYDDLGNQIVNTAADIEALIDTVNTAPVLDNPLADDNATEGQAVNIVVPADTFSDPDAGDILSYSATLVGGAPLPSWLGFDGATQTFTGTPPNNSNGSLDIEVTATDAGGLSVSDDFTLGIADANFAPQVDNPIADTSVAEDTALNYTVPADAFSDSDIGDTLTYSAQLSGGGALPTWLSFDALTQTFTGTPPNNSNGDIEVEVIATDAGGLSASDTFTLTVTDANFAPTLDNAIADANATEGQALNVVVPADTFSDPDTGDALTYTAQLSGGGALPSWLDFDALTQTFTGTPPNNSNGSLDIEVIATDGGGLAVSDTFTLDIADANFAPTLDNAIADAGATEGQALNLVVPGDAFSDPDTGDALTYTAQLSGGGALPSWLDFDALTQTFTGTPPNNSNGSLDVEVTATDAGGLSVSDTFTLDIADANFAPTLDNAIADAGATEGQALNLAVPVDTFSDPDTGDALTYTAQLSGGGALPSWLDFDALTQTFTGTPPNNSNGSLDIEVIATDGGGLAVSDTFTLDIADANFAPTLDNAIADAGATEGQALNLAVPTDTFSDPDTGDALTYTAQLSGGGALPSWLDFDALTQTFTGTPPNNSNGGLDIEVIATDGGGLSTSDTFTLNIADANFAPNLDNAIADANATEGQALNVVVPADTFSDPDAGDALTYTAQLSGGGALPSWLDFDALTQTFTGTPPNNSNGSLDIEVIATDGGGLAVSDTFTLDIADANFAPTLDNAIADAGATEGQALNLAVPTNTFSDPDTGDALTYTAQLSGGGALPSWLDFDALTQTFTGTPPNNSNGGLDIEVIATDGGGLSTSDTFTLNIADANFAPTLDIAIADAGATEGQALNLAVPVDTFSDPDTGDALTYTAQLSGGGALPSWLDFDALTQTFTGTPPNNSNGSLDIEVIATDGGGLAVSDTFTLDIADANFAPTLDNAIADAGATEGQVLNLAIPADTFSDPDVGDALTYTAQLSGGGALPSWLDFDALTQTFTGTPPNNSNGGLDIEVIATDGGGLSTSDTFTLNIADANFAPNLDNAIADANATEGQALNVVVPADTFSDPDAGDALTYTAQLSGGGALPSWLDFDALTQTFTGTPPNNSNGSLDIEVIATDGGGLAVSDTFTLDIADANFAPTLDNALLDTGVVEEQPFNFSLPPDAFSDPDIGDTLSYTAQLEGGGALPAWLDFDAASQTFTGTPPNGSSGDINVEVIATDGGGLAVSDVFTLTVNESNAAPILDNPLADSDATEGQALNITVPADAFSDPDSGDTLTYSARLSGGAALPAWLTFDFATLTFAGTPPNNSNGSLDVEVVATDGGGLSASDTFTLDIADANFAPTLDNAIADAGATEGQALNLAVPTNTFSDPDTGDALTYTAQLSGGGELPSWLDFDALTQTFTGTPPNNSNGGLDIEVIAIDGGGLSTSDTFTLNIADANFAPNLDNAIADANATEGQALNVVVPADTFSDPDAGDALTYTAQLSGGGALPSWLDFDALTQTFSGTPPNNSNGSLDVEVTATDAGGLSVSDTFTLDIADANFAPTLDNAIADAGATEGQALNLVVPGDAFSDPDTGDALTYTAQLSGGGALPSWLDFDALTQTFTGTPPNNSNGSLDVEVTATDAGGLSVSDTFTLDIADANFAPTLDNAIADAGATEGQVLNLAIPADTFSDPDTGDALTYTAQLSGGGALPSWLDFDALTQTFTGTPPNNSNGSLDIEVIATDGGGLAVSDTFTLDIADANFAPTLDNAIADAGATEGQALNVAIPNDTFSDPDAGDALTYQARLSNGDPLPAWLNFDALTQTFTGTPPNNSNGSVDVEVTATDTGGLSASDTFTLNIADANFAPTLDNAIADAGATEGQALNVAIPNGTFSDPDAGDALTYEARLSNGDPLPAWLGFDALTQTFTGTPPNNSNGSLDVEVTATDAGGLSASDTFTLDIADANFAPTLDNAIADAGATEEQALDISIPAGTFSDPDDGDVLSYTARLSSGDPLPAWLDFDATTQSFSGTPPNGSSGDLDIEVTATDSGGLSVSDSFILSIAETNLAPTLDNPIADAGTSEGDALALVIPGDTFSDPDTGDSLTYTAQLSNGDSLPAWLQFDAATQTFTGTPPNNSNGAIDIDVTATDTGGLSVSDTFTLNIADTNFAPTLDNAIADVGATEGQALNLAVPADTFSDPDAGDALTYEARLSNGDPLPTWLDFDALTQTFSGTPPNNSNGSLDIEVVATDSGGLSVSDTFALNIADANFSPVLDNAIADAGATEGQALNVAIPNDTFSDPDAGDALTYEARLSNGDPLPAWLGFDALTQTFTGTPPNNSNGSLDIEVVATDGGGLSVSDTFALNIADANFAPTLDNAIADGNANEDQPFDFTVPVDTFSDPDNGDTLTLSAQLLGGGLLPAWLAFDAAAGTFTGTPPAGSAGSVDVEVIATDSGGLAVSDSFTITVSDGSSVITGTDGDDMLMGTSRPDEIFGLAGNDVLRGEGDDDLLDGGAGADMLFGGDGADTLIGRGGRDDLYGGLGNDTLTGGGGRDELFGEEGDDNLSGGGGRDMLFGGDGADTLSGGAGDDILEGGVGDDILQGGDDDDVIRGNEGSDELFGDAGDDTLRGGAGTDTLFGGDGNDTLRGQGGADVIRGELGDDRIFGGGGADDIRGNQGNDDISGGAGNDFIRGNSGNDIIFGDEGDDELVGNGGSDQILGGDGDDTISGGGGADDLRGNAGVDIIAGGGGADTIRGNGGADTIQGDAGSDDIRGDGGRDIIAGGDGNDTIDGGRGRDTLSGDDGSDTYIFDVGDGSDTINNASTDAATDTLQFGAGVTSGELAFSQSGSDLLIDVGASGDTLRIEGWFDSAAQEIDFVETTEDGVVLTAADINAIVLGGSTSAPLVKLTGSTPIADPFADTSAPMSWDFLIDNEQQFRWFDQDTRVLGDAATRDTVLPESAPLISSGLQIGPGGRDPLAFHPVKMTNPDVSVDAPKNVARRTDVYRFTAEGRETLGLEMRAGGARASAERSETSDQAPEISVPLTIDDNDRSHVLVQASDAPVATDLTADRAPELSVPLTMDDGDRSHILSGGSDAPIATDLTADRAPELSVPLTMDDGDRSHILSGGSDAPIATDLTAERVPELSAPLTMDDVEVSSSEKAVDSPDSVKLDGGFIIDTAFEDFRSAIEEFDGTIVRGVARLVETDSRGYLVRQAELVEETVIKKPELPVMESGTPVSEIDRSVHQFVASIAVFGDRQDFIGEKTATIEEYETNVGITLPPI